MATDKHFDLLTNARDSLAHALQHIVEDDSPSKWKISVREVAHVIELILKERLRREHPAFLWVKVEDLNHPEKNTLTLDETQVRLDKICGVRLSTQASKTLALCKKLRNQIEHFEFRLNEKEARAIVARLMSFIFSFTQEHLQLAWESEFRKNDTWQVLVEMSEFAEEHEKVIHERLKGEDVPTIECPNCLASVFNTDAEKCELCGHSESLVDCFSCGETVWESLTELTTVDAEGEEYICNSCINAPDEDQDYEE